MDCEHEYKELIDGLEYCQECGEEMKTIPSFVPALKPKRRLQYTPKTHFQKRIQQFTTNEQKPFHDCQIFDCINIENECSICLEELLENDTCELKCGHYFHSTCLKKWYDISLFSKTDCKCPYCRTDCVVIKASFGGLENYNTDEIIDECMECLRRWKEEYPSTNIYPPFDYIIDYVMLNKSLRWSETDF